MLYKLNLPDTIREQLTDVVYLQIALLLYASKSSELTKYECIEYFNKLKRFQGRHQQIADWIWRTEDSKGDTKLKLLQTFATGSSSEKRQLIRNLFRDILILFNRKPFQKNRTLTLYPYSKQTELDWKIAGAKFLYNFYGQYLDKLPINFWGNSKENKITKKELRQQILDENTNNLRVCPSCDFGNQEGQVDHYLPKSLYTHLSCHPFNLVPICYSCNSLDVKRDDDLLSNNQNERFNFQDILHLYIDEGLARHTYLKVNLPTNITQLNTLEFMPKTERFSSEYLKKHDQTYQLTERWIKEKNKIGVEFFDKLKENIQFIQPNQANKFQKSYLDIFDIIYFLDSCLIDFKDKQGKTAFSFPMTWWLATLINQQIEPVVNSNEEIEIQDYPFLAEIASWLNQKTIQHPKFMSDETLDKARDLRKIAQ
jgi:hypothetical protein